MKAQLELSENSRIFSDANSTLRVTYGKVKGYEPKDGVYYNPITYLDCVMEKYIPSDYEFDVSPKLIDLYKNKDFGNYGEIEKNARMLYWYQSYHRRKFRKSSTRCQRKFN
jgi:hypothetical protein